MDVVAKKVGGKAEDEDRMELMTWRGRSSVSKQVVSYIAIFRIKKKIWGLNMDFFLMEKHIRCKNLCGTCFNLMETDLRKVKKGTWGRLAVTK